MDAGSLLRARAGKVSDEERVESSISVEQEAFADFEPCGTVSPDHRARRGAAADQGGQFDEPMLELMSEARHELDRSRAASALSSSLAPNVGGARSALLPGRRGAGRMRLESCR